MGSTGLCLDRRWMLVDEDGRFISQRKIPAMARLQCSLIPGGIRVEHEESLPLELAEATDALGATREVRLLSQARMARDRGEEAAAWFSKAIGQPCRLVEAIPEEDPWKIHEPEGEGETTYFPDLYPILLTSEATLQALFPAEKIEMARFRPNLVLAGAEPFAEDQWDTLQIGNMVISLVKPCARCAITTVDPETGIINGQEPLRTLAETRSWKGKGVFGWNAIVRTPGRIAVGDCVKCLKPRDPAVAIGRR